MATNPVSPAPGPSAAPAPEQKMSAIARIFGVFFGPKAVFEDVARKPGWIAPVVLLTILGICVSIMMNQKVNWAQVAAQQIDQSPQAAQMSPEQREAGIQMAAKISPTVTYVFGTLGAILFVVILAAIFLGAFNLFAGAGLRYSQAMGIVAHAFLPSVISSILLLIVLAVKNPAMIDPQHLLATNAGAFLASDAPKWLSRLLSSLDIFWIWMISLMGIGFSAASPKKVSTGKAMTICFGLYFFVFILGAAWALI